MVVVHVTGGVGTTARDVVHQSVEVENDIFRIGVGIIIVRDVARANVTGAPSAPVLLPVIVAVAFGLTGLVPVM